MERWQDLVQDAATTFVRWSKSDVTRRASVLESIGGALDQRSEELVEVADEETHLGKVRLSGELRRTSFQLRLFAEVLREGSVFEATIDHADENWGMGPRPDLRRILVPVGPVLVFAASNFPFAFSTMGGDSASALAAGCPVILKAHPGHPRLTAATAAVVREVLESKGVEPGVFSVLYGDEEAREVLLDERIKAGAFTGSFSVGRYLFDLANSRRVPIPFYAEMGSVNPVIVTREAIEARGAEIAHGYTESFTLGAGQFCTKPGLLFIPAGSGILDAIKQAVEEKESYQLLNDHIASGFSRRLSALIDNPHVTVFRAGQLSGSRWSPTLLVTTGRDFLAGRADLGAECFGPASLCVEYESEFQLLEIVKTFEGELTGTIWAQGSEAVLPELIGLLSERVGRVLFNGWPTGVSVTWAMTHGGPYPATTSVLHTSVGTTAMRRFLRPVSFQSVPDHLLPPGLEEENSLGIPRRVDGVLHVPASVAS